MKSLLELALFTPQATGLRGDDTGCIAEWRPAPRHVRPPKYKEVMC